MVRAQRLLGACGSSVCPLGGGGGREGVARSQRRRFAKVCDDDGGTLNERTVKRAGRSAGGP